MILYKSVPKELQRDRKTKRVKIEIDEKPKRPDYIFKTNKDRVRYIDQVKAIVRKSKEYKDYIKFLRDHLNWNSCAILEKVCKGNGKKYTIEIHHEPFVLHDYVDTELNKMDLEGEYFNPYVVAERVIALHYDGKVGLIPLSKTQHELVGNGKIFIPLQFIYHNYAGYYMENEEYISDNVKEKIEYKIKMSQKCDDYQSNVLVPEFTYVDIDGFMFPQVPEEWGKLLQANLMNNIMNKKEEKKSE